MKRNKSFNTPWVEGNLLLGYVGVRWGRKVLWKKNMVEKGCCLMPYPLLEWFFSDVYLQVVQHSKVQWKLGLNRVSTKRWFPFNYKHNNYDSGKSPTKNYGFLLITNIIWFWEVTNQNDGFLLITNIIWFWEVTNQKRWFPFNYKHNMILGSHQPKTMVAF